MNALHSLCTLLHGSSVRRGVCHALYSSLLHLNLLLFEEICHLCIRRIVFAQLLTSCRRRFDANVGSQHYPGVQFRSHFES